MKKALSFLDFKEAAKKFGEKIIVFF